jgi:hemoglobin-like flavoprotein
VFESAALKKHATSVISTVGVAVVGLSDLPRLIPVLQNLGTKHVSYGVEAAHYDVIGQALLDTLALGLGEGFTPEVKAAWAQIYGVIATTMKGDHYS